MVRLDRLWWLGVVAVFVLIAAGAVLGMLYFRTSTTSTQILGLTLPSGVSALTGVYLSIYLACIVKLARWVPAARWRQRLRARAIAGDLHVMPPADIATDPSGAFDVSHGGRLALYWRLGSSSMLFASFILLPAFVVLTIVQIIFTVSALSTPPPPYGISAHEEISQLAMVLAMLLVVPWSLLPPPALWLWVGLPPSTIMGVVATDEGLRQYHGWRRGRLIRWHEARLLEVERENGKAATREYALFSERGLITWNGSLALDWDRNPDAVSAEEWADDQRALLDLIAARTGLTPRTFEPALARAPEEPAFMPPLAEPVPAGERHPMWQIAGGMVALASFAGGVFALARGTLSPPLTTQPLLNDYAAGSIAFVGFSLLVGIVAGWVMTARRRQRVAAEVALPPPPLVDAEQAVDLVYRPTWYQRLILSFYSLIVTSWLVSGVMASAVGPTPVTIILMIVGLVGFVFFMFAIAGLPITAIRADALGLQVVGRYGP